MKILLVNPPRSSENAILRYAPEEAKPFIHKKLVGPPLGLLTIAASVSGHHDVRLIDMKGEYDLDSSAPEPEDLLKNAMDDYRPDVIGITAIASELPVSITLLKKTKTVNPDVLTVIGGLHPTLCPEDCADPSVDIVCAGQSANKFREIIAAREKGLPLEGVRGLFVNNGHLHWTGDSIADWDPVVKDFIPPDRSLLERWKTTYRTANSPDLSTYIFTSLGCPHRCSFCTIWPQHNGVYRNRETESVIQELKSIEDYPIVRFADANTVVDVDFIERLFDRITAEGLNKFFIMDVRFDTACRHPRIIEKLARGGLQVVICGFESYRQNDLDGYNKQADAGMISEAIRIFHENGIMVRGNYIVPPDYDEDDFKTLSDYASMRRVVYAGYTVLTPMPGSDYYRASKADIADHDLSKYNFFNSVFKTKLSYEKFHENVGRLWMIKEGRDVI